MPGVPLSLTALVMVGAVGLAVPDPAGPLAVLIALLLYATCFGVPFAGLGSAFTDVRFLLTVVPAGLSLGWR